MVLVKNMATISCTCHPPNGSQFVTEKISQPHEEKGYLLPTWAWKLTWRHFDWMLQLSFRVKVKEVQTNPSLEVNSKVGEDCSSLPASSRSSATRDFKYSILVEALLWGCHLDVQDLLHQQLLSSTMIQHCGLLLVSQARLSVRRLAHKTTLLPVDWVVVLPCMHCYRQLLNHPASPCSFSLVSSLRLVSPM